MGWESCHRVHAFGLRRLIGRADGRPLLGLAEYIAQPVAICEAGRQQLDSLEQEFEEESEPEPIAARMHRIADLVRAEFASVHELASPPAQRPSIESMLTMWDDQIDNVDALAAYESNDQARSRRS